MARGTGGTLMESFTKTPEPLQRELCLGNIYIYILVLTRRLKSTECCRQVVPRSAGQMIQKETFVNVFFHYFVASAGGPCKPGLARQSRQAKIGFQQVGQAGQAWLDQAFPASGPGRPGLAKPGRPGQAGQIRPGRPGRSGRSGRSARPDRPAQAAPDLARPGRPGQARPGRGQARPKQAKNRPPGNFALHRALSCHCNFLLYIYIYIYRNFIKATVQSF